MLSLQGTGPADMQKTLAMDARDIMRLKRSDEYRLVVDELSHEIMEDCRKIIKTNMAQMSREVIRVITERLATNDLDAVKIVLKTLGFGDTIDQKASDSKLIVNFQMPEAVQKVEPLTIECKEIK